MFSRLLFSAITFLFLFSCHTIQHKTDITKVERDGVTISYTMCGEGDTTLFFMHGWGINKGYWQPQLKHFCDRFKVVAIDLPGFGESGKTRSDWNFDEYAADVKAVIDQLKLKNVILIGHSMSGDIVLNVGNKYPSAVIGLVGIDNLHEPGTIMNEQQQKQTDTFFMSLSSHFDSTVNTSMKGPIFQPTTNKAIVDRVMNDVYSCDSVIATKVLRSLVVISQTEQQLMQGLPHKLYLVNSDVNPTRLDSLNKYCRYGCEVMPVHTTGHYPMLEKPEEFNTALEKVFAKIADEKSK